MTENENYEIADLISKISPYIRFIGVISKTGELLSYYRREDLEPLLDQKRHNINLRRLQSKLNLRNNLMTN